MVKIVGDKKSDRIVKVLNLQRGLRDDRLLRALTGLNRKAVEELKLAFKQELLEEEVPRRSQERRQRAKGAGRKPRLKTVEEKLIDILFYFKCDPPSIEPGYCST